LHIATVKRSPTQLAILQQGYPKSMRVRII
jgi:hypothetical protein